MNIDTLVAISQLFIPVIAFVGIYIAWQQFITNRENIRFELYDKRFRIYDILIRSLNDILWLNDNSFTHEQYARFETVCNEAEFLLPDNVCKQIHIAKDLVRSWRNTNRRLKSLLKHSKEDSRIEAAKDELIRIEGALEELQPIITEFFKGVLKFKKF
jgi:hypothetical protein